MCYNLRVFMQNIPPPESRPAELYTLEQRALPQDTRERALFVIARNIIPVIGVLFLGWSAVNLVLLYFVDTLGGMWALIAALLTQYYGGWTTLPWKTRFGNLLWVLGLSFFLIAFFAIPLGVPVLILTQIQAYDVRAAFDDTGFVFGLVSIAMLALVSMFRHVIHLQQTSAEDKWVRNEFGLLFVRWTVMIFLIFTLGAFAFQFASVLLILGYAIVLVISELYPQRFLAAFDKKSALPPAPPQQPPTPTQRARWERKRKRRKK